MAWLVSKKVHQPEADMVLPNISEIRKLNRSNDQNTKLFLQRTNMPTKDG